MCRRGIIHTRHPGTVAASGASPSSSQSQSGATSNNETSGRGVVRTIGRIVGEIWGGVTSVVGTSIGLLGIPTGGIGIDNGQIQFEGNFLQRLLGSDRAVTIGAAGIYPRSGTDPGGPGYVTHEATGQTTGMEEGNHSTQNLVLGPFYIPAHILTGTLGIIGPGHGWHGDWNFLEKGPHDVPPRPF
jgi:hypothetical protein